jgi:hypothetical protein
MTSTYLMKRLITHNHVILHVPVLYNHLEIP